MAVAQIEPRAARVNLEAPAGIGRPVLLCLFVIALMTPVILNIGPFAFTPSRLFVLLVFFPVVGLWLSGRAGPVRLLDFTLIFAASWAALSVIVIHGVAKGYERAGFIFLEMVGGYFFGRTAIRSAKDFNTYMKFAMGALIFMLPLGILETRTGEPLIIDILSRFIESDRAVDNDMRLGLHRAQVIFPHPILYGVFCAAMLGPVARGLNYGTGMFRSMARIGLVAGNTFCSVSSGAWLMFLVQAAFLIYDRVLRSVSRRWLLWFIAVGSLYLLVEVAANSSPFKVFVRYFTLNSASGFYRIAQFDAAMVNILDNPIFGRAFNGWVRPRWMIPSIDNYWLVLTVRHGLPMFFVFLGGILVTMYRMGRLRLSDPLVSEIRAGYLIGLGGFLLAVVTVHVWSNVNVWFMFFLGSGMWLFDAERRTEDDPVPETGQGGGAPSTGKARTEKAADVEPSPVQSRYSRFPARPKTPGRSVGRRRRDR